MKQPIPDICYLICATPHSGSQLFAQLLADTTLAGNPGEFFNPWHMGHAASEFPKRLIYERACVEELMAKHTTPNGVFGVKAHFTQVTNFVGLGRLESLFPTPLRYISLTRKDNVRQAISLARAVQTGQFSSDQPIAREPVYNNYQIQCCLREVLIQEKGWETYFAERGIEPFRVVYEELVEDRSGSVLNALKYLGVSVPDDFQVPGPRMQKQADHMTEEWVARFTADNKQD
jgi:LPS sulfotransferase NodH